jgi:uncharacterized protein
MRMDFETAKKAVDIILKDRVIFNKPSGIFYFFGGEAFLEMDLVEQLSAYIVLKLRNESHPWNKSFKLKFSTNGLLYDNDRIQKYIEQYLPNLMISITIDGTKEKHDNQRIYPDGRGSYDDTVKNVPLWLKQFPNANTKVTIAPGDLPYMKDSIIHLWSLGIKDINIVLAWEDLWKDGDDEYFEDQLIKLSDYIIDKELYKDYFCLFFNDKLGTPRKPDESGCGSGRAMIAVDPAGNFFPCLRFLPSSMQSTKPPRAIGNCSTGIDYNKVRPFFTIRAKDYFTSNCIECDVATGCLNCLGLNYDYADTNTAYKKALYGCKMHKAHARANKYYWDKLSEKIRKTG